MLLEPKKAADGTCNNEQYKNVIPVCIESNLVMPGCRISYTGTGEYTSTCIYRCSSDVSSPVS